MKRAACDHRSHCPISYSLDIVGDRWTLLVLRDLVILRKRYFRDFLASEEKIASNILTSRLQQLAARGIVTRRPDPENARQVIYEPTAKGLALLPAMLELARWGATYDPDTAAPRGFARRVEKNRARVIDEIRAPHSTNGGMTMPHDPHLAERMRAALKRRAGITEKKMFGGYCWMLRGNMLCGVEVGRYMFRVGKELEAEALKRPGASPMDITGRPMRGFVWVRAENATGKSLQRWIDLASRYVGDLPPKQRAQPSKR